MASSNKNTPSWSDVKSQLTDIDRAGLIGLVQDLYAAIMWYRTNDEHLRMATELVISNALRGKRTVESYQ